MAETQKPVRWELSLLIEQVRSVCEITDDGCWLWRYGSWARHRYVDEHQYPRLSVSGVRKHVSRWVLEASGFPEPPRMEPAHSCDRPPCVNPAHLRWRTHKENMQEMGERRRSGPTVHPEAMKWAHDHPWRLNPERIPRGPRSGNYACGDDHYTRRRPELVTRGEAHRFARLNENLVRLIRRRREDGEGPVSIARDLDVGLSTIQAVLAGRTWKHVT